MLLSRKSRSERKAIVNGYLSDHPCIRCGESDIVVLDFHHRDPRQKTSSIAQMINTSRPIDLILAEIEKCDVLCSNCHRRHHVEERVALRRKKASFG